MRLFPAAALALSALFAPPVWAGRGGAPAPADPGQLCRRAAQAAEHEHRLPAALLHAIARVETGRADPRTGAAVSWPWTVNAEGQGRFFATKAEAVAAVRALQGRGVSVIDVGCLQVNLHHHPGAFASIEEAFDPLANARYAGLFLSRLHRDTGDWERAAGHYHSRTPGRGDAYRAKVMAAWPEMAGRVAADRRRDADREALAAAWGGGAREAPASGFHAVASGPWPPPGNAAAAAGRGLPDPAPAAKAAPAARPAVFRKPAAKPGPARRQAQLPRRPVEELAEAPPPRRR